MPGVGGTIEWLAVAFGAGLGTFAYKLSDEAVLDTLARLGVAFPAGLLTDAVITPARRTAIDRRRERGGGGREERRRQ